jgi:drug/metabolite transporter (DMT)-like permease
MTKYRIKAYTLLLIVAIIWGVAGPVIKFTLRAMEPLPFLNYRFYISALFGIILLLFSKTKLPKLKKNWVQVFIYSFLVTTVALGLLFVAFQKSTVLDVVLIAAVSPLMTVIAGAIFLNEHITKRERIGISIAFLGTIITIFEPMLNTRINPSQFSGNILVIGYLLANSSSSVLAKKLVRKGIKPFTLTHISFLVGFFTLTPLTLFLYPLDKLILNISTLPFKFHLGVIYMALFSGTLAYALWVKGQKTIEISEAGLFAYLSPLFSIPLAIIWLKESITIPYIFGAVVITMGVIVAEYKKAKKVRKDPKA